MRASTVERDIVALTEAQRRDCLGVDGFCQLTTVTKDAITQRILRHWPISLEGEAAEREWGKPNGDA